MAAELEAREIAPNVGDYTSIIRLEAIQMAFGAVQALSDIDLAIGRNEIVGPDRRQRRRQVDPDQGDDRRGPADQRCDLVSRPAGRPRRLFGAARPRARHRDGLPGEVAGREAAALAQLLRRPPDHQPLGLHRRRRASGGSPTASSRTRSAFAASASTPTARWRSSRAASARGSRSAGRCTSRKT